MIPAPGGLVTFTAAGLAAFIGQASTYLASAKVTAIAATGATAGVNITSGRVAYSCLSADAAAALAALVTVANVAQAAPPR